MTSSRFDATQELLRLHDRINRLFNLSHHHEFESDALISGSWTPACDIVETPDALVVTAELPGVRRDDIDISLDNGVLTLRGHRDLEQESQERTYHRIERSYGHFTRAFTLPRSVNPDQISATYVDGVLSIRMPRREETRPRQIQVKVE